MLEKLAQKAEFFAAIRADDVETVRRGLAADPSLAKARWPGRSGDGKMRSLGPPPFNQHSWLTVPSDHAPDDPRYTSTPLIFSRNDEIVRLLVEAGADVNALGTSGEIELPDWHSTPLWRAAHDGRLASVRLLVERGANCNYLNPDGSNQALKTAAENDAIDICRFLLDQNATPDLITAAMLGRAADTEAILRNHPSLIDWRDSHGRSALDAATLLDTFRRSRKGLVAEHDRAAEILIDHGAIVELEHAASLGRIDLVRSILKADPDLLRRQKVLPALIGGTAKKETALQAARRRKHDAVVDCLLECGAEGAPKVVVA